MFQNKGIDARNGGSTDMNKVLMFLVLGVFVFTAGCAGCKKSDAGSGSDSSSSSSNYAGDPSSRGDYEVRIDLRVINFDFDKYEITDAGSAILRENAKILLDNTSIAILVEGHTDERGTSEYNLALGQRRADAVKSYYVQLGVAAKRIATISYGKEKPVNTYSNEEAWAQNRRAETLVAKKK